MITKYSRLGTAVYERLKKSLETKKPLIQGLSAYFHYSAKEFESLDGADGETRTLTPRGART